MKLIFRLKQFQQIYTDHIDPDGIQPVQALRTAIAAILAMIVYRAFDWPQAYWILPSAILILQNYNSPTPKKKWQFLLMTGAAVTLCTFAASLLCKTPVIFALFLMSTTFITVYLNAVNAWVGNAAFYVNLFCLSAGALPLGAIDALERTTAVAIGFFIAVIVCLFVRPERLIDAVRSIISENLWRLSDFNRVLSERAFNQKALSVRRNRLTRGFQLAREIIPPAEIQSWQIMIQIEYLYEIILILKEIKSLIEKQKILGIVNKELKILSYRLTRILRSLARSVKDRRCVPSMTKFIHTLQTFEKYYRRHFKKFNHDQFLSFTVYIDAVHKLEKRMNAVHVLIKRMNAGCR